MAFKTMGDVATLMLSIGHKALVHRHLTDSTPKATYATTIEEMADFPEPENSGDLYSYLGDLTVAELCALVATGGSMLADMMLEINAGDAEAARDAFEAMMLRIRQQEVGL